MDASSLAQAVKAAKLATLDLLLAGVAHEINTPLGAINSNHDTLKRAIVRLQAILEDEVVTPEELAEVRRIVRALDGVLHVNDLAVDRVRQLVDSLKTFGRPDHAELELADLQEGLDSTVLILGHELRNVEVRREYTPLPPILCHPHQLNEVFMNLLVNARQAVGHRGTITIRTRPEAGHVVVEIEDDGVGIPADHLERIFEPGFTTKNRRVGMGLGLLIARQVVEQHHGTIAVRSTPGTGSCFTVRLPLAFEPDGHDIPAPGNRA